MAGLTMRDVESCQGFLVGAWKLCVDAAGRRDDAFRTPVLVSSHPAKGVQARVVVLRGGSEDDRTLDVHSDRRTDKVAAILADPRVSLLFWDAERQLQVRIEGIATVFDALTSEGGAAFDALSDAARAAYRHHPDPGTPIPQADGYETDSDRADDLAHRFFRLIRIDAQRIEALSLANGTQARAAWTRAGEGWEARWIVP